jgi:LuxR family maltose regulon positive regulatory protein
LERALEPDGALLPFVLGVAPELLERHRRHRTSHAALVSDILDCWPAARPHRRRLLAPSPAKHVAR